MHPDVSLTDLEPEREMADGSEFMLVFLAFYGSHMLPARPGARNRLTAVLGKRLYLFLHALDDNRP